MSTVEELETKAKELETKAKELEEKNKALSKIIETFDYNSEYSKKEKESRDSIRSYIRWNISNIIDKEYKDTSMEELKSKVDTQIEIYDYIQKKTEKLKLY